MAVLAGLLPECRDAHDAKHVAKLLESLQIEQSVGSTLGAATEAEDEYFVARIVLIKQPFVSVGDIPIQTLAKVPPKNPFTPIS
jgi:hypothetical protein